MKYISLDVWDTIVRRNCHPDEIKVLTADHIVCLYLNKIPTKYHDPKNILLLRQAIELEIGSESQKNGLDDEYNIRDVISRLLSTLLGCVVEDKDVEYIVSFEKDNEFKNTYIDPTIKDFIDNIGYDKCFFISDFYFDGSFIKELLAYHGVNFISDGVSSCDVGLNKRSGRLFDWFLENLLPELSAEDEYYHIGDNEWSDVKVPQGKGIKCFHYLPEVENSKRLKLEYDFRNCKIDFSFLNKEANSPEDLGVMYSPLFFCYLRFILNVTKARKIDKIFFMTREGEFFKKVYDLLNQSLPDGDRGPESELICVSRIATFFPSLRELSLSELMRVWNLYSSQSMSALFKTLGIDGKQFSLYLDKYRLIEDELILYPWLDERVKLLFSDDDFISALSSIQEERKKEIILYFSSIGLTNSSLFALVDIGWRGTIQDNISYLMPDTKFIGFYIGLERFLNEQPTNSEKIALGPDLNLSNSDSDLFRTVAPLEMISNSPNGSVVKYVSKVPIRKIDNRENQVYTDFSASFQSGVLKGIESISKHFDRRYLSIYDLKLNGINTWRRVISQPHHILADAYFSLVHNEDFGLGEMVDKSKKITFRDVFFGLFDSGKRQSVRRRLASIYWPEGYFSRSDLSSLDKLFTIALLKLAIVYRRVRINYSRITNR